jgi:hypothetical protein
MVALYAVCLLLGTVPTRETGVFAVSDHHLLRVTELSATAVMCMQAGQVVDACEKATQNHIIASHSTKLHYIPFLKRFRL